MVWRCTGATLEAGAFQNLIDLTRQGSIPARPKRERSVVAFFSIIKKSGLLFSEACVFGRRRKRTSRTNRKPSSLKQIYVSPVERRRRNHVIRSNTLRVPLTTVGVSFYHFLYSHFSIAVWCLVALLSSNREVRGDSNCVLQRVVHWFARCKFDLVRNAFYLLRRAPMSTVW